MPEAALNRSEWTWRWAKARASSSTRISSSSSAVAISPISHWREDHYRRSVFLKERVLGSEHPEVALARSDQAAVHADQGRVAGSEVEDLDSLDRAGTESAHWRGRSGSSLGSPAIASRRQIRPRFSSKSTEPWDRRSFSLCGRVSGGSGLVILRSRLQETAGARILSFPERRPEDDDFSRIGGVFPPDRALTRGSLADPRGQPPISEYTTRAGAQGGYLR